MEKKTNCDRNCATCPLDNRTFCAVQIALANQQLIMEQAKTLAALVESLTESPMPPIKPELDASGSLQKDRKPMSNNSTPMNS